MYNLILIFFLSLFYCRYFSWKTKVNCATYTESDWRSLIFVCSQWHRLFSTWPISSQYLRQLCVVYICVRIYIYTYMYIWRRNELEFMNIVTFIVCNFLKVAPYVIKTNQLSKRWKWRYLNRPLNFFYI